MDVAKFIEERNRMCKSFDGECKGCPAFNVCEDGLCCAVGQESTLDATAQIAIVEEWSATHPINTRQSLFLEQWPETKIDNNGCICVCPMDISITHRDEYGRCLKSDVSCLDCRRDFWMKEVK